LHTQDNGVSGASRKCETGDENTIWPEDNHFCIDEFRVLNTSIAQGQGGVAIIVDQTTACITDKLCF